MNGVPRSLGDRLAAARRRAFVGRQAELELFIQALEGSAPFSVLFIHGPGGIGKSTLLDRLADEATRRDVPVTRVEARSIEPRGERVLGSLGVREPSELAAHLGARHVVLLDTYEELAALDAWIRDTLVPSVSEGTVIVLAGRSPPSAAWRTDPGLASISRVRALRNLRAEESAALLEARGVAASHREGAHALTHGHPLALALVAELAKHEQRLPSFLGPDVVRVLLDCIVRELPNSQLREALEIAAMVRFTTEALLAELGVEAPTEAFAWMRGLAFISESADGLAPHDLVRDALLAELEHRAPDRAASLHLAIAERNRRALVEASGRARERAFYDSLFALRRDPTLRPFYDWELGPAGSARALREDELPRLLSEIERHEGPASAAMATRWWSRERAGFLALLGRSGEYLGAMIYLHPPSLDADDEDPAIRAMARATRHAPARPGEEVAVLRHWIWERGYQTLGSDAHGAHSMVVATDWALRSGLAWVGVIVQNLDDWRPFFVRLRFEERPELAFSLDDVHRFGVLVRDMRAEPWSGTKPHPGAAVRAPLARVVLSREDFAREVREALRFATRPQRLAASPLLASRLVDDWAEGETPSAEMLRELLVAAASSLDDGPDERPRRCVEATFLAPAPTHEAAAEQLRLSFSTYRRQLARGVEGVIAWLWDREVRGAG